MTWTIRQRSRRGPLTAIDAGAGPLVVLIHGVGLRAEAWGAQIDALSQDHRVLAFDMPGHGGSARVEGTPALAAYTETIAAQIDAPCVVIGHSFGAMIALDLAVQHGALVNGVAALNAIFRRDADAARAVQARAASLDGTRVADPATPLARWFGQAESDQSAACRDWLLGVDPAGYRDAYAVFADADGPSDAALASLRCPALFLTGAEEPNSTPAMSQAMAVRTPQGRAEIIAGAAHMMPMTHADQTNAIIADFLKPLTERT
ncbi:alpha/beta hydrolase [Sulfitobacter sp. HNIBRBA2951]|uniref:alpha/beta fold hydrolase n=1 Tax=Sulfitobacter aquimarinus TaxID=3158557 RepID=UPI0032E02936